MHCKKRIQHERETDYIFGTEWHGEINHHQLADEGA